MGWGGRHRLGLPPAPPAQACSSGITSQSLHSFPLIPGDLLS